MLDFPQDENGDVLRRMQESGFDFSVAHDVEFFAVFRSEQDADAVAMQFVADHKSGDHFAVIDTYPAETGGMELKIVKSMFVTHENVTVLEKRLEDRIKSFDAYMDGWGVMQPA